MLVHLRLAVITASLTCTVILVDDGLLRINAGCTSSWCSLTWYVVRRKFIVEATHNNKKYKNINKFYYSKYDYCGL